ncbi:MAG: hypothetical protein C0582_03810 [Alphaproteobacteria bacterium]|nr:MAG: hypothetical protein C0582_03810 [Alphaproteobacteria bacterium]
MKQPLKYVLLVAFLCGAFIGQALELPKTEQQLLKNLNDIHTYEADFVQINDDGSKAAGRFYMDRPNQRLRFIYSHPEGTSILAKEGWIKIYDADQDEEMSLSIDETPAQFFLNGEITLDTTDFQREIVEAEGRDTLLKVFDQNSGFLLVLPIAQRTQYLMGWHVRDINGKWTRIRFSNIRLNQPIDEEVFRKNKSFTSHRDK